MDHGEWVDWHRELFDWQLGWIDWGLQVDQCAKLLIFISWISVRGQVELVFVFKFAPGGQTGDRLNIDRMYD